MRAPAISTLLAFAIGLTETSEAQVPRNPIRIDDPQLSQSATGNMRVVGDGATRVAVWRDHRNGEIDFYMAVSNDHGHSWGPESAVTQSGGAYVSEFPKLSLENGILHFSYVADYGFQQDELRYKCSDDLGQSWSTETVIAPLIRAYDMEVLGDRVLCVWRDNGTPTELRARWSTDAGLSFGSNQTIDPLNQGQYEAWEFDAAIVPFSGAGVVLYEDDRSGERNLYLANGTSGSALWGSLGRVDGDLTGVGEPGIPNIKVQGLDVHMAWMEHGRPGSNGRHAIYYRSYLGAVFQPERRLGQYTYGGDQAINPRLRISDTMVALCWEDDRSGPRRPYVAISHDDGASFQTDVTIPQRPNTSSVNISTIALDGHKILLATNEAQVGMPSDEIPVGIVSGDAGVTWSSPFDFDSATGGIDDVWFPSAGIDFRDDNVVLIWGVRRNPGSEIRASGIRFPVVEYQPVLGGPPKGILRLKYAKPSQVGQLARWAASTATGQVVHPENPALFLDLAPGGIYNQSLAKANLLTATIAADGTAQTNPIPIKPGLVGRRIFIQGWVNENGVGQPASDVLFTTL